MTVATLFLLTALATPAPTQDLAPPGMVFVAGDGYKIGTDVKIIKDLIEETQQRPLASECPVEEIKIEDFYIMPTEVTNEQFAKFVAATNSEPPQLWGEKAVGEAGLAYAERTGKQKKDARDAGLPVPEFEPFSPAKWWEKNWQDCEWSIPKGLETTPVVYITYESAEAYARWAGLRLISEPEFQAAARGNSEWTYPWGDKFELKHANSIEANLGKTSVVGSFPDGAAWINAKGVFIEKEKERNSGAGQPLFDLVGNVWEWTRSPFLPHKGFKPLKVTLDSGKDTVGPDWDANKRICCGGSYQMPDLAVRVTVRRGTERSQSTSGIGMRCSASVIPGFDVAHNIMRAELPTSKRPDNTKYIPENIIAIDKWESEPGTATAPGYKVISSYNCISFIPVESAGPKNVIQFKENSHIAPIEIGAFTTTVPILEPALEPGTYLLSWRSGGEGPRKKPEKKDESADAKDESGLEAPADAEMLVEEPEFPFDIMQDTLIFRVPGGDIAGFVRCGEPQDIKMKNNGTIGLSTVTPEDALAYGTKAGELLNFKVFAPNRARKGYLFNIPIMVAPGAVDQTWRK
ncbi:MAG: sulfatase modifying factor 1 [Gammaproteobacteria bacterium]